MKPERSLMMRKTTTLEQLAQRAMSAVLAGVVSLALTAGAGAATNLTWGDGSNGPLPSGSHNWNVPGNWTSDDVPNTGTLFTGDTAIIGDTTADRTITTPNTPLTIFGLDWTQSVSSSGVNKIVLGSDVTISGYVGYPLAGQARIANDTGNNANLVLDLNGHTLDVQYWIYAIFNNMTILSSAPGGTVRYRMLSGNGPNLVTGPGVIFESMIAEPVYFGGTGMNYHPESVILLSAVGNYTMTYGTNGGKIGGFQIGQASNPGLTKLTLSQYGYTVQSTGKIELFAPGGDPGQVLDIQASAFYVGGDFIDHGPVNGVGYGDGNSDTYPTQRYGRIIFNNNPSTARTILMPRNSLNNDFFVGNPSDLADKGNIKLAHDLTTTGSFTVKNGSRLDVDDFTLTSGNFTSEAGAIYTYTAGTDTGVIHVIGNLSLGSFTLNVVRDGTWDYLHDLVLFTYTGTFSGSPVLTLGSVPGGFTYGALLTDGGVVRLTSVGLPEPTSALLLGVCLGLSSLRRRG